MPRLSFRTKHWSCPLTCRRCSFKKANGLVCKNKVCLGLPFCTAHNSLQYGVRIKPSTIAKAGKGLFATRDISKDAWICPYVGELLDMRCVNKRYPGRMTAPYTELLPGPEGLAVDAACTRGIASLANARFKKDGTVASLGSHNCKASYRPVGDGIPGIWLKATKTVRKGEEVFLYYGEGGYLLEDTHSTDRRANVVDSRPCKATKRKNRR